MTTSDRADISPPGGPGPAPVERLRLWHRFHVRLTAAYGVTVLLALSAMAVVFYRRGVELAVHGLKGQLRATAVALSQSIPPELVQRFGQPEDLDDPAYQELVRSFSSTASYQPDVFSIYVLKPTSRDGVLRFAADWAADDDAATPGDLYNAAQAPNMLLGLREPTVEPEPYTDEFGTALSAYAPLAAADGSPLGLVGVDVLLPSVDALRRSMLRLTLGLFGVAAAVLGGVAWLAGRRVHVPLARVIAATTTIQRGDFAVRTGLDREDEFGILARGVDRMAQGLAERERIRATFGRYVGEEVAGRAVATDGGASLGGELRQATVLFCAIRGYGAIAERLAPTQAVALLNSYLEAMAELVDAHGGYVVEFVGDAVMAVFNAPRAVPDHAAQAVRCAVAMRGRMAALLREWQTSGLAAAWAGTGDDLGVKLGVHSGEVVAGNLGSATRVKYAVIGDTVNVAARAQGLSPTLGTDLLFTRATWELLPEDLRSAARDLGAHPVKGRSEPVTVLTI